LVAVVVATLLATLVSLPVLYVEVPNNIAKENFYPTLAELRALFDPKLAGTVWFFIAQLAIIASAETLLCASAVDRLHSGDPTDFDRELKGQGVGNLICGMLCALPMTGVIVRSSANVQAGARSRLSAIFHGLWLLLFVGAFAWLLRNIPMAALAGILVYTGYKLVDVHAIRSLARRGKTELGIYLATVIVTVSVDLLYGVIVGLILSVVKLLYVFSWLEIDMGEAKEKKRTLNLRGAATFLKLPALAKTLESIPPETELHVNVDHLYYIDAACLDLFEGWQSKSSQFGGRLVIKDVELLAKRMAPRHHETNGVPRLLAAVGMHQQKQRPI
jgi:MFS superfamily sulfate permease-like transporter